MSPERGDLKRMTSATYELLLVTDSDLLEIPETRLGEEWEDLLPLIRSQAVLEAAVVLKVPGQPEGRVQDELWALAENLCFRAVCELAKSEAGNFVIKLTSTEDHVVLLPLANQLRIIGEDLEPITGPRAEMLPALFECGLRIYDLFIRLGEGQEAFLERLRPLTEDARRALSGMTL